MDYSNLESGLLSQSGPVWKRGVETVNSAGAEMAERISASDISRQAVFQGTMKNAR